MMADPIRAPTFGDDDEDGDQDSWFDAVGDGNDDEDDDDDSWFDSVGDGNDDEDDDRHSWSDWVGEMLPFLLVAFAGVRAAHEQN